MSRGIPLSMIWDVLDKKYKFIARDGEKDFSTKWYAYTSRPTKSVNKAIWLNSEDESESLEITLPIDAMHDVPWDQTLIERPIPIQEGAFGKFWDGDIEPEDKDADWGYLLSVVKDVEDSTPYEAKRAWWEHFIPKIPTHLCINKE